MRKLDERFWRVLDVELLWFQSSWMLHSGVVVSGTGLQLAPQGVWYRPKHGWVWGRFQCNLTTTKTLSTGKLELLVSQRRKHVNGRGQLRNETHLEGEWRVWWLVPYLGWDWAHSLSAQSGRRSYVQWCLTTMIRQTSGPFRHQR